MAQTKRSKPVAAAKARDRHFDAAKKADVTQGRKIARQSAKSDLTRAEIKRAVAAVIDKAS